MFEAIGHRLVIRSLMKDSTVNCDICHGSGRTIRGHDGRNIRCPKCLGEGIVPLSASRNNVSQVRRNSRPGIPREIHERQRHSRGRRRFSYNSKPRMGAILSWIVVPLWFLLGALSTVVVIVPGTGYPNEIPRIIFVWLRIALISLGLIAALIAVGIILGFIESQTWPWEFTVPKW